MSKGFSARQPFPTSSARRSASSQIEILRTQFLAVAEFETQSSAPILRLVAYRASNSSSLPWQTLNSAHQVEAHYAWPCPSIEIVPDSLWALRLTKKEAGTEESDAESDFPETPALADGDTSSPWDSHEVCEASLTPVYEYLELPRPASSAGKNRNAWAQRLGGADQAISEDEYPLLNEIQRTYFDRGIQTRQVSKTFLLCAVSPDRYLAVGPVGWKRRGDGDAAPYVADVDDLTQVSVLSYWDGSDIQPPTKEAAGRPLRIVLSEKWGSVRDTVDFRSNSELLARQLAAWDTKDLTPVLLSDFCDDQRLSESSRKFTRFRLEELLKAWELRKEDDRALEGFLLKTETAQQLLQEAVGKKVEENQARIASEIQESEARLKSLADSCATAESDWKVKAEQYERKKTLEEETLTNLRELAKSVREKIDDAKEELARLKEQTTDAREAAKEIQREAEDLMISKIGSLREKALQEMAALLPIRIALGLDNVVVKMETPTNVPTALPVVAAPVPAPSAVGKAVLTALDPPFPVAANQTVPVPGFEDLGDVNTRLKQALRDRGGKTWELLATPVVAAGLAGLVPVVAVEDAAAFWQTVAGVLCGGRRLPLYLAPDSREPLDLFGRRECGVFSPHAHRLADLLLSYRNDPSEALALVTIENAEAFDWNAVMGPILSARDQSRALSLLHGGESAVSGAYQGLKNMRWPDSLLIGASWSPSGFPPPAAFFRQAVLLLPTAPPKPWIEREDKAVTAWTTAAWKAASTSDRADSGSHEWEGAGIEVAQQYPAVPVASAVRFFRGLRHFCSNEEARRLMCQHAALPPLVAQARSPEEDRSSDKPLITALQRLFFGQTAF